MKKVFLGITALCLVAFTSCKKDATQKIDDTNVAQAAERDAQASNFPVLEFTETEHDFGEIEAKENVETVFNYTNSGKAPLVITDISSSCGCTIPKDWSKEPLSPGETGQFTVKFNGSGSGNVTKTITVTANTETGKETVRIKAFVKPDPNAPATPQLNPSVVQKPAAGAKTSTQPGHEGHNHD